MKPTSASVFSIEHCFLTFQLTINFVLLHSPRSPQVFEILSPPSFHLYLPCPAGVFFWYYFAFLPQHTLLPATHYLQVLLWKHSFTLLVSIFYQDNLRFKLFSSFNDQPNTTSLIKPFTMLLLCLLAVKSL